MTGVHFPDNHIPEIPAKFVSPSACVRSPVFVSGDSLYIPRDVGRGLTVDDALFVRSCTQYIAEKTDGVGSVLSIVPSSDRKGALTIRHGPVNAAKYVSYVVNGYDGPAVTLDGEFFISLEGWKFDAFGLLRYENHTRFQWFAGMTVLHRWLTSCHRARLLLNIGVKEWVRCTPSSFERLWKRVCSSGGEGVVFKFPSSPCSWIKDGAEFGTARYLKRVVTYDVRTRYLGGGYDPPVDNLPERFDETKVIECSVLNRRYQFIRYRPDKAGPNSSAVLARKAESSSYDTVVRWLSERADNFPVSIDLDDNDEWSEFIRRGDSAVDDLFRLNLAATGFKRINLFREGRTVDSMWVYQQRTTYYRLALQGKYDVALYANK